MKKIILLAATAMVVAGTSANAEVSVGIGIGAPVAPVPAYPAYPAPAYVEPGVGYAVAPDWPSEHYDRHRHPHNDYWAHRGGPVHRR